MLGRRWLVVFAVFAAACSSDGTTLREPGTGGATPRPIATTTVFELEGEGALTLASPAFGDASGIPPRYAQSDSLDVSPPLAWTDVPAGAEELALVVVDRSSGGVVHWVLFGLDSTSLGLGESQVPPGAGQALNHFAQVGWTGPAPDPGGVQHAYLFTLFALRRPLDLADGLPADEVIPQIEDAAIAEASLVGLF